MLKRVLYVLFFMLAHLFTYLVIGSLAYHFITKQFYGAVDPVFYFMRTESQPELWKHVMTWILPGQIFRGILMGIALLPFMSFFSKISATKGGFIIAGLYYVFSSLSASSPKVSNVEGLIYLLPEYINLKTFFLTQPEMIIQALALGFLFCWFLKAKRYKALEEK